VYVCTETSEHPKLVEAAARAGKHVFCEKPLAKSYADAKRMLDAVEAAGVVHQVGLVLRCSPVFRVLEDMMAQDNLGPLLAVQMRDDQFFPDRGHYASKWRNDVDRAGGGTLIEHSIHDVDLLMRLFGPVNSVDCRTRVTSGHDGVEDVASVSLNHEAGHTSQLLSVWHGLDDRASTRRLEVFFEGGWFMTEHDYFGTVTYQGRTGESRTISADEVLDKFLTLEGLDPAERDLKSIGGLSDRRFVEAAAAGRAATPSFVEAVAAHRVVDACYLSAAERRITALAEIAG
jgi:predicted dehydrogenase